jgi:hypothetical protein
MNRLNLDALESIARHEGGTENGIFNLGDTYDKIHLASKMLSNVLLTKSALARLVEQRDCERAKQIAYFAISQLIDFAMNYHHQTVVAHETAIKGYIDSVAGARRGAKEKGKLKNYESRDVKMAERFLELRNGQEGKRLRASDSALKDSVGEEFGLRPTSARAAIKKGLKIIATRKKVVSLPGNPQAK